MRERTAYMGTAVIGCTIVAAAAGQSGSGLAVGLAVLFSLAVSIGFAGVDYVMGQDDEDLATYSVWLDDINNNPKQ